MLSPCHRVFADFTSVRSCIVAGRCSSVPGAVLREYMGTTHFISGLTCTCLAQAGVELRYFSRHWIEGGVTCCGIYLTCGGTVVGCSTPSDFCLFMWGGMSLTMRSRWKVLNPCPTRIGPTNGNELGDPLPARTGPTNGTALRTPVTVLMAQKRVRWDNGETPKR